MTCGRSQVGPDGPGLQLQNALRTLYLVALLLFLARPRQKPSLLRFALFRLSGFLLPLAARLLVLQLALLASWAGASELESGALVRVEEFARGAGRTIALGR